MATKKPATRRAATKPVAEPEPKKPLASYRPTEGVSLLVGAGTAIVAAITQHQWAAVAGLVLAVLPAAVTYITNLVDSSKG